MPESSKLRRILSADDWEQLGRPGFSTDQRAGVPAPPLEKPYPADARLLDLIWPDQFEVGRAPVVDVIRKRESRRKFTPTALSLEELSFLLWSTQGLRRMVTQDGVPVRLLRNVPSGGGRHPFETYLAVNRVEGVPPGLYRYLSIEHKLLPVSSRPDLPAQITRACRGQSFVGEGAVVFFWTAFPYRAEWRYSTGAYKLIALDAGHVCQNLYLAAEAIGAGTCAIAAYDQKVVDGLVGVDGEDEFVIYLAPVGFPA